MSVPPSRDNPPPVLSGALGSVAGAPPARPSVPSPPSPWNPTAKSSAIRASSPLVWKVYIESLAKGEPVSGLAFRDKRNGWNRSTGIVRVGGREVSIMPYRHLYSLRYTLRRCCSSCPYTSMVRESDITIGDFWHLEKSMPDFADPLGTSLVLVHTARGRDAFDAVRGALDVRPSNARDCWQLNLERPTRHVWNRRAFWRDYRRNGIAHAMDKFSRITPSTVLSPPSGASSAGHESVRRPSFAPPFPPPRRLAMSGWEAGMLICFGVSWPVSIAKALRTRRSEGKSRLILSIILLGYACGLVHKWLHDLDWIMALYALNFALVAVDLALCLHYRRHPGGRAPGRGPEPRNPGTP